MFSKVLSVNDIDDLGECGNNSTQGHEIDRFHQKIVLLKRKGVAPHYEGPGPSIKQ